MDLGTVNGAVDVLGALLALIGAVYMAGAAMSRSSGRITRGLLAGLVGALVAGPLTLLLNGVVLAIGLASSAYSSPSEATSEALAISIPPLLFGLLVGIVVGARGGPASTRPWLRNGLLLGMGFTLLGVAYTVYGSGAQGVAIRLYYVALIYWFVAGGLVEIPTPSRRAQRLLSVILPGVYVALVAVVALVSQLGQVGFDIGANVEAVALEVSVGASFGLFGFAFCNPPPQTAGEASIGRFLLGIAAGLLCAFLLPLLTLMVPVDPDGVLPYLAVPVAITVALANGQSRLLLYRPRSRWVRKDGRLVLDRDIAIHKFGHGVLVGYFGNIITSLPYWYSGAIGGTLYLPANQRPDLLGNLYIMLAFPVGSLPIAMALGLLEILAPWLSHRVKVSESAYIRLGIALTALGLLIAVRESLLRLLGAR